MNKCGKTSREDDEDNGKIYGDRSPDQYSDNAGGNQYDGKHPEPITKEESMYVNLKNYP